MAAGKMLVGRLTRLTIESGPHIPALLNSNCARASEWLGAGGEAGEYRSSALVPESHAAETSAETAAETSEKPPIDSASGMAELKAAVESMDGGSSDELSESTDGSTPAVDRKERKKLAKAARRAKREGRAPAGTGMKACGVCGSSVDMLIRCRIDETRAWKMVCGRCWKGVSGGVTDGDADHPWYQYGGLWRRR
jgi:hypothetical protein